MTSLPLLLVVPLSLLPGADLELLPLGCLSLVARMERIINRRDDLSQWAADVSPTAATSFGGMMRHRVSYLDILVSMDQSVTFELLNYPSFPLHRASSSSC